MLFCYISHSKILKTCISGTINTKSSPNTCSYQAFTSESHGTVELEVPKIQQVLMERKKMPGFSDSYFHVPSITNTASYYAFLVSDSQFILSNLLNCQPMFVALPATPLARVIYTTGHGHICRIAQYKTVLK